MAASATPSSPRRIHFIVLGNIAGLLVLAGASAYWAFRHFAPDLRAIGVAIDADAAEFAKSHKAEECTSEALARGTKTRTSWGA